MKSKTPHVDHICKKMSFWMCIVAGTVYPGTPLAITAGMLFALAIYDDYKEQKNESQTRRED